ncbi:hypothetical protein BDZ89DRAFT_407651 [Hymenopellis radicata]|nr:hypothetical protein BDZ89DRAFT_407651 [Hymenopellis radicata]
MKRMRARIALRKTGVDHSKEEDVKHEMKKVEVGKGIRVSPADVVDAFISGDELLLVQGLLFVEAVHCTKVQQPLPHSKILATGTCTTSRQSKSSMKIAERGY